MPEKSKEAKAPVKKTSAKLAKQARKKAAVGAIDPYIYFPPAPPQPKKK